VIVETPGIGQGDAAIVSEGALAPVDVRHSSGIRQVVPADRVRCLAEITDIVRGYHTGTDRLSEAARRVRRLEAVRDELAEAGSGAQNVESLLDGPRRQLPPEIGEKIEKWRAIVAS
jgi:methylmalonyl-CoA mutase